LDALPFKYLIAADCEYDFGGHSTLEDAGRSGERPRPVCYCAKDLRTGQTWEWRRGQFLGSTAPFPTGPEAAFIAWYASAEMGGIFKPHGWTPPVYVLDLFTEFRAYTNGRPTPNGASLLGALTYFGLDGIGLEEKRDLQLLIVSGGPWTPAQWSEILAYCWSDVDALARLLPVMLPHIDLPHALLRGRSMKAAAEMEWNGVPCDVPALERLRRHWTDILDDLIVAVDRDYGVFEGRTFKLERWERYLATNGIPWPRLESGRLDLSDDTFRQMARSHPAVSPMRELRSALSEMRLSDLAVGSDGRNRTILSAFRARTGRYQPSNTKFIFGPSVWLRSVIKPPPGHGIAYIDWSQQEDGIGAALSGDAGRLAAHLSGDTYLSFGKQARAIPADATKETHGPQRELFKQCVLAVQYGMEAESLAHRIGQPVVVARDLLRTHRETYRPSWAWSDAVVDYAVLNGVIYTTLGWPLHVMAGFNARSLRNFPMQANGAEMLRLACCFATEQGIEVCAPVHDAVLICAPLDRLDDDIARMQACMAKASRIVLAGFELRTDVRVVKYPNRYQDPRGTMMWNRVMQLLEAREAKTA
jgi:hypothetical protein